MKLPLLIFTVLRYLVLTSQEDDERGIESSTTTEMYDFNENGSYIDDPEAIPCKSSLPESWNFSLMITFIIVFVFSMIGNSIVVYVVCYMKKGRATTDIYLMHLAVADLLFSITLPFWAVNAYSGWIFGNFLCKVMSGFQEASVYCSVFLLACISVDRHFAIVRATRVLSSHHLLVKVVCIVVWGVAGLLSLPVIIQKESNLDKYLDQPICHENLTGESSDHWRVGMRVLRHTVGFFLPLMVMAVCYGWTMVTLFHTRNQQKRKAIRVILAVVLAFVVCWLPYNISVLIDTLIRGGTLQMETCKSRYGFELMLNVTQLMAFTHCAVNPVLYAFIGVKFRNQLFLALYKHGLISKQVWMTFRRGSVNSVVSTRSRNTSATM